MEGEGETAGRGLAAGLIRHALAMADYGRKDGQPAQHSQQHDGSDDGAGQLGVLLAVLQLPDLVLEEAQVVSPWLGSICSCLQGLRLLFSSFQALFPAAAAAGNQWAEWLAAAALLLGLDDKGDGLDRWHGVGAMDLIVTMGRKQSG